MIRKLSDENLMHAFPEVAFSEDYIIATYQAKVKTRDIEKMALAIADHRNMDQGRRRFGRQEEKIRSQGGFHL